MARKVGKGSKKPRSTAKREAQKSRTVRMLPKAKRDYIIDDRPSQRKKGLRTCNVALTKAKYENVPGTRVQAAPGGRHVRVIIQDGKTFDPGNVSGARRHLKKLADEAAELARIHGGEARHALAKAAGETAVKANSVQRCSSAKQKSRKRPKKVRKGSGGLQSEGH
ncbi:unnamed protein product [Durusdinium trenchii]|uniref:Uncharacterized protein n=2 Tax=Durusdinium trenchii TaxID=1381693 RepID=A0ABP0SDN1_9DINO